MHEDSKGDPAATSPGEPAPPADPVARQAAIVAEFQALPDWQSRYRRIIEVGRTLPELDESLRTDRFRVKGCQSQVWLVPSLEAGHLHYRADSDAAIVRGLIALLLRCYSGLTPAQIVATDARFVDELGLSDRLSQSRANGLAAMIKQLRMYAVAFQAMAAGGKA